MGEVEEVLIVNRRRNLKWLLVILLVAVSFPAGAKDRKLTPEELVSKHLESLGSAEARGAVKTRALAGSAAFVLRLGAHGEGKGAANVLSDRRRTRIGLKYQEVDYTGEQFGFDGETVTVGFVRPGQRSLLSQFVFNHQVLLKEGLLGGVLTAGWALLDVGGRKPKLGISGLNKVEGHSLYELKYRNRKGSTDLQISMYFDAETFRHMLTEYRLVVPSGMPDAPGHTGPRDVYHTITESFDDFKIVDGLMLPHFYKLVYTIEGPDATYLAQWTISDMKIGHNPPMQDAYFVVQ
jgi:hypothetical protein